ncbi:MAG: hypothetical protein ABFR97_07425 [Thermodesulfobacteriota bacterium]
MDSELKKILVRMGEDLPHLVAAAVVMVEDGLPLAEFCQEPKFEAGEAAAYLASIVKSNRRAIKILEGGHRTDDILITTDRNFFLIRHDANHPFFIFVMTSKEEWLGRVRIAMKKYEALITAMMVEKTGGAE